MTQLFQSLHDPHDDPAETRVDQGDGLPDPDRCSFLTIDTDPDSEPCPHHTAGDRLIEGLIFPACTFHRDRGGILHRDARRRLVLDVVARQNTEAVASTEILDADGAKVRFPRFCRDCGARLFTGNLSGTCADCADLADLDALDAANHAHDLEVEHHDGSPRDR